MKLSRVKVGLLLLSFVQGADQAEGSGFHDLQAEDIEGHTVNFAQFANGYWTAGKTLVIANVPKYCGNTENSTRVARHYLQLATLYKKFSRYGFEILLFPCDQFRGQHGIDEHAMPFKDFMTKCSWKQMLPQKDMDGRKINAEAELGSQCAPFKLMTTIKVNGPNTHPVYQFLKETTSRPNHSPEDIEWNMFTYFVVTPAGQATKETLIYMDSPRSFNNSPDYLARTIVANLKAQHRKDSLVRTMVPKFRSNKQQRGFLIGAGILIVGLGVLFLHQACSVW